MIDGPRASSAAIVAPRAVLRVAELIWMKVYNFIENATYQYEGGFDGPLGPDWAEKNQLAATVNAAKRASARAGGLRRSCGRSPSKDSQGCPLAQHCPP